MECDITNEWVKPELKVISFAKTSETVLNISLGGTPPDEGEDFPPL